MSLFFVPAWQISDERVVLEGSDVNHVRNVLRKQIGDRLDICDGQGNDYFCRIEQFTEAAVVLSIEERRASVSELPVRLHLYQGLPKKDKMELIIQKAIELGAASVVPVAMSRSIMKVEEGKKEARKLERWNLIAEGAAKQSGRGYVPEVRPVMSFSDAVQEAAAKGMLLLPYENAKGMLATKEALAQAKKEQEISIFIGPEGGFSPQEIEIATKAGASIVSLGSRILRTETAGMTMLSVLMMLFEMEKADGSIL